MNTIGVLDKGYIELVDHMGDDLMVVNCARVSFAKEAKEFGASDEKLLKYLIRHKHYSPFYHPQVQFRVKCPISVGRQWFKHKVGTAENSESTRYVEVHNEFYVPSEFRAQSTSNKQGSDGILHGQHYRITGYSLNSHEPIKTTRASQPREVQQFCRERYTEALHTSYMAYEDLLDAGVAKEQAREVLPLCTYFTFIWTGSLMASLHFLDLRDEEHSQWEIQQYAKAMRTLLLSKFPITLESWSKSHD